MSSKMPTLRMENLIAGKGTRSDWCELNGVLIKAAMVRHLSPFINVFAHTYFDSDTPEEKSLRKVTSSLCRVYSILSGSGMFLNAQQLDDLKTALIRMAMHFQSLRGFSQASGFMGW